MSETSKFEWSKNLGHNWATYKIKARAYALSKGASDILDGKMTHPPPLQLTPPPSEGVVAAHSAKVEAFLNKNNAMWSYLIMTQGDEVFHHVRMVAEGDCAGLWRALLNQFESSSKASLKQLIQQLTECKQNALSVPAYMVETFAIRARLKEAVQSQGVDILDLITSMVIVQGLGDKYETLKEMLFLDDTLSLEALRAKILEQTQRIDYEAAPSLGSALAVGKAETCTHCGRSGHTSARCWLLHPELKTGPPRGKPGGDKKNSKRTTSKTESNPASSTASASQQDNINHLAWQVQSQDGICRAVQGSQESIKVFELDSGSSDHIAMDDTGLDEVKQASQKFEVADQRIVTSQGYGSIGNKLKTVHVVPSFGANLMSMIQLYRDGKATLFHPTHGIMIAEAEDMHITCSKPLCVGYIEGNSFKVDIKVPPKTPLKARSPIPRANITRSRASRIGTPTLEESIPVAPKARPRQSSENYRRCRPRSCHWYIIAQAS